MLHVPPLWRESAYIFLKAACFLNLSPNHMASGLKQQARMSGAKAPGNLHTVRPTAGLLLWHRYKAPLLAAHVPGSWLGFAICPASLWAGRQAGRHKQG